MFESNADALTAPVTVRIERNPRGGWQVEMPDLAKPTPCETLDDARRMAYLWAARARTCELIVEDAYHRVLHREVIAGSANSRRSGRS